MTDFNVEAERIFKEICKQKKYLLNKDINENEKSSIEDFMYSLKDASTIPCDDRNKSFNENVNLPHYFDEELYKKGQKFFRRHIFALIFSKTLGLITSFLSSAAKILVMTDKSSTPIKSYQRYVATFLHMCTWYQDDFRPGSRLWESIRKVRAMHNNSSKQSVKKLNRAIYQLDMIEAQVAFIGFALCRSEMVGIYDATEEEWKGFIHLWRVVGYLMGIDDRYNICTECVEETRARCNIIIETIALPLLKNPPKKFKFLTEAFVDGLNVINPMLDCDVIPFYIRMVAENLSEKDIQEKGQQLLTPLKARKLRRLMWHVGALRYTIVRIISNCAILFGLWMLRHCPTFYARKFERCPCVKI